MGREYSVVLSVTLGRVKQRCRLTSGLRRTRYCLATPGGVHCYLSLMTLNQGTHFVPARTKNVEDQPETMLFLEKAMLHPVLFLQK